MREKTIPCGCVEYVEDAGELVDLSECPACANWVNPADLALAKRDADRYAREHDPYSEYAEIAMRRSALEFGATMDARVGF